ncbi:MAG: hypothetical protein P9L92_07075 [Candidatus Electryonea clarkiae]|nr:hypothetical protein [Candidatus Electryonea clarkiae]MDP8286487.1 hypothetical protein [Candidatus Electryonea clarkiae]
MKRILFQNNRDACPRSIYISCMLGLILIFSLPSFSVALDEVVLIIPPVLYAENCMESQEEPPWDQTIEVYNKAVLDVRPVKTLDLLQAWGGDTVRISTWSIDEAMEWGQALEVDRVIISEWSCDKEQLRITVQSVDPWEGNATEPEEGTYLSEAIRKLENMKWIYGAISDLNLTGYQPPSIKGGPRAIHDYLHKTKTYPPEAAIQAVPARIDVNLIISGKGVPIQVNPPIVTPSDWLFEKPVEQALWALRYAPATIDGKAVIGILKETYSVHFIQ